MSIKVILFDHDGTLVDSEPTHFRIWQGVLAPYGAELSEAVYREHHAGLPALANAEDMIARFSLAVEPTLLARQKAAATREFLSQSAFPLMPGVLQVVRHFHTLGLRQAIVTGSGHAVVTATARTHGLEPMLATTVSSDDVERNKPHPDGYLLAMQRLGVSAEECVAVEDTEHGLAAAVGAGITCLAVPNDMSQHQDFSRAADRFGGLADIVEWVEARRR
ncbi:HAD family hydrolase [Microbulbifer hainanensis]|uniref:HAD family hydrolase n=1 Tax=Microbulbifer hainanensis TaxID=2735675 RepID=UPI0018673237|nr:HAD family phosphatase [Microbulbifer hainanensis]